jgi:hypothetical protein
VVAYNRAGGTLGVISIADVFRRGAALDAILVAWQKDAVQAIGGAFEDLPPRAPGHRPALVRGSIAGWEVLAYMWSRGNTIATIEVTGKRGEPTRSLLLALVRRQNAKLAP